jgi:hypothetical protein
VWRLAALESRPTEGAAPPFGSLSCAGTDVPQASAYKRVSYLAETSSDVTCLMTATLEPVRAHTLLLVERAVRAHWRFVSNIGRGCDQRADLTGRFIKASTPTIFNVGRSKKD